MQREQNLRYPTYKQLKRHFVVWAEWHSSEYAAIEFVMYYCPSYFCAYRN
jgi:hypothetical protein